MSAPTGLSTRARLAIHEGLANVFAPGLRQWLVVIAIAGFMAGPAMVEWQATSALGAEELRRIEGGEFSYRISTPATGSQSGAGLAADHCWRLAGLDGVRAAGPVWDDADLVVDSISVDAIRAIQLSPGALAVLARGDDIGTDLVIGSSLASLFGVADRQTIAVAGSPREAGIARNPLGARLGGGWAIVGVPGPDESGDCLLAAEPAAQAWFTAENLGAFFGAPVTVTAFLSVPPVQDSVADRYANRASRFGWVPSAGLASLLVATVNRGRRRGLSVYKLVGLHSADVTLILLVETVAMWVLSSALVVAGLGAVLLLFDTPAGLLDAVYSLARFSVGYLSLCVIATVAVVSGGSAHSILQAADA